MAACSLFPECERLTEQPCLLLPESEMCGDHARIRVVWRSCMPFARTRKYFQLCSCVSSKSSSRWQQQLWTKIDWKKWPVIYGRHFGSATLRIVARSPDACIVVRSSQASTLGTWFQLIDGSPALRNALPTLTSEVGDTWMYVSCIPPSAGLHAALAFDDADLARRLLCDVRLTVRTLRDAGLIHSNRRNV
jgi:hypothetical protein